MKELLSRWNELRAELNGKHLLLLLDFDGTLSRLRNHPDKAVLSAKAAQQLRQLALSPDVTLGFISGRDLASLRSKLKIKQAIYAGGHGCHIQGPRVNFRLAVPTAAKRAMNSFYTDMARQARGIDGVLLEKKAYTIGVHYWRVHASRRPALLQAFHKLLAKHSAAKLYAKIGKNIVEACLPSSWHKGDALLYILKKEMKKYNRVPVFPIYIGDDVTDEDAFRALRGKGLAVKVGLSKKSHAPYYLRDIRGVHRFLGLLSARRN